MTSNRNILGNLLTCWIVVIGSCYIMTAQTFVDVSVSMGIDTTVGVGGDGNGISTVDFNGDGWEDLTFGTEQGQQILFYANRQDHFELIPAPVTYVCNHKSVLWVDLDNDGDKDFFVTCDEGQNRVFENTGNLTMVDRTAQSGLAMIDDPSRGATFGDFDNDGLLDVYTTAYNDITFTNALYKNNGNFTFTDVTAGSGVAQGANFSFQGTFFDLNNNTRPDIYVSIDKQFENLLFKNLGGGTFQDISVSSGANIVICSMNASSGDFDNDGDLDLYSTNTPTGNVFLRNNGDETFTDITVSAGVEFLRFGWATSFVDVNNDGWLDMYVSAISISEPNALYINQGNSTFSEPLYFLDGLGGQDKYRSYCNTQFDFNHDGRMDLVTSNIAPDPINVWENQVQDTNRWIKVDLEGTTSNRDGIGVWILAHCGVDTFSRYTTSGDGYLGQQSDISHIGLGTHGHIDSLRILWPSGTIDRYFAVRPNQLFKIVEGTSSVDPTPCPLVIHFEEGEVMIADESADLLISSKGMITSPDQRSYFAPSMSMNEEFTVEAGSVFEAILGNCNN